jgi:phosphate transport system substrate-binding protein
MKGVLAMTRIAVVSAFVCASLLIIGIGPEALAQQKQTLVVRGDSSVAHLIDDLTGSFMKDHPQYSVVVSGGEAASAVQALLAGEAQVGMSAHQITPDEEKLAESKGMRLVANVVDWEGVALICHPSNPVQKLTMDEVRDLLSGKYTNWSQVKGRDAKVDVIVVETPRSGIGSYFNNAVLGDKALVPSARVLRYFKNVVAEVAKDPAAIGYAPIRFVEQARGKDNVTVMAVARSELHAYVAASRETVKNRSYLLITPLFLFYDSNAKSEGAQTFVEYCAKKRLLGE